MNWGYVRVSVSKTDQDQSLQLQKVQLLEHGIDADHIFEDLDISGDKNTATLSKLIDCMQPADTLVVTNLDRLSRSLIQFCRLLEKLDSMGLYLRILAEGIDTKTPSLSQTLLISILMIFADFELQTIRGRTKSALLAKKLQGVTLGRPLGTQTTKTKTQILAIKQLLGENLPPREIVTRLGISRSYFYHLKRQL